MKDLKQQSNSIRELKKNEVETINGGAYWWVIPAVVFMYDAISDFREGWNSVK